MAPGNFGSLKFIRLLILVFIALPVVSANVDCGGKAFHCVNTTHFKICVDLGGGVSKTIDSFIIPCPISTECRKTNRYECEFPKPVVLETVSATSVPDEISPFTAATTVSADTSGSTPTEFLQSVTGTSESSKTELYKITTDISEVGSFKVPPSNSEQGTTEHLQNSINTNTPTNIELIEIQIVTTELYQTSNQTGLKNKTEISDNLTKIMNTSEFSQGTTDFTTPAATDILEIFSGTSRKKTKYSQVLDIQSEVTQEVVEISAPITTEIFQNLKDKIVLNETVTFEVSQNTSVTNNIGYKQDPTEASESIITEMTKLSKQTSLTNKSDFYQEPVFTSIPSTTETLKGSTYISETSKSDFSQSQNGINELFTAEIFQSSTDGIIPNETELFELSTTSRILKKSDIFQGPDEMSATITNETFQSSTVANVLNKTELFETSTDSRVLNTSENYQGLDEINGHEMLQTSTNAPFKPEVLKTLTDSRLLNISDMFQGSNSIKSPFITEKSKNSIVTNESNETELFESSTTSSVLKKSDILQGPDAISSTITTETFQSSSVVNEPYKTELFETSDNYYQVTDGISKHEMLQSSTNAPKKPEVLETLTDSRILNISDMFQRSDSINASLTTELSENATVANELNKTEIFGSSTESTVSNATVFPQGKDKTRALITAKIFKTTTNASVLNKTDLFEISTDANVYETVTNQPDLFEAVLDTRSPITIKVSQTISDTNEHFVLQSNSSGTSTQSSKDTMGNDKNDIRPTTENSVLNKYVLHQGYLEITTPFKVNVLKTSQVAIPEMVKKYDTTTFSPSSEAPLKVTHPDIVSREQGVENQIEWSNVTFVIDNAKENHSISDSNNHTTLTIEDSNSNNLLNQNITTKVNNIFLVTKNVSAEYENSTAINSFVGVTTVDANSNNFVQKNLSNGHNDLLMSPNKEYTFDATESDDLISGVSNPNDLGIMASSNRPIYSTMYDTTESYFTTLSSQDSDAKTVSNKEENGNKFVVNTFAVLTPPTVTIQDYSYYNTELQDFLSINTENSATSNNVFVSDRIIKTALNDTNLEAINNEYKVSADEISRSSVNVTNKETVKVSDATDLPYKVLTPVIHNSVTTQDWAAVSMNLQLEPTTNAITTSKLNSKDHVESNLNTPESYLNISKGLHEATVIDDLFSKNTSKIYVRPEASENSTQMRKLQTEKNEYLSNVSTLPPTDSQIKNTDTATETSIFEAVEPAVTIVKELTHPQNLSPTAKKEFKTTSTLEANTFDLEQSSSINSISETKADHNKYFVTKSNIVVSTTPDAATETSIFKAVESAATIGKDLIQSHKNFNTPESYLNISKSLHEATVIDALFSKNTSKINVWPEASENSTQMRKLQTEKIEYLSNVSTLPPTDSQIKNTDTATETSIFKAVEPAVTIVKELTHPQNLSPTAKNEFKTTSTLEANTFDLEQSSSINSISETKADHNKYFVTISNIVESTTPDAATETSIFKAVESAATIGKDLTQSHKNLNTFESYLNISKSLHEATVIDDLFSKNTSKINVRPEASENSTQMRNMQTEQIEYLSTVSTLPPTDFQIKNTDAATETSIYKAVESAVTIVKELTHPQNLSPTAKNELKTTSSLVANSFDLEQTGSINSFAETKADNKKYVVTESIIVEPTTTDAATETSIFKAVESAATIGNGLTQPQKLFSTSSNIDVNGLGLEQTSLINAIAETSEDYKKHVVTKSNIVESKNTDATTDTSISKAVESAATVIKELAQPQKLSPTPSSLVANGFDLEQTGSINTITETTLDYKKIVVKESNIVGSTTYINYLDNTESNLGNGQNFSTTEMVKPTPSGADLQHFTEQISAALNIPEIAFPPIHEQKILNSKDIDLQKNYNVQHSPSETSIKEQSTQQRAMNTLDKQTKRVNQDVTTVHNLNINTTSEPFFTVSDAQVGVIPIGTNSTKKVSSIAHSLIHHMDILTSSNTYYSEAETRNVDNDGSRISLELPENKLNESKYNVTRSTLNPLLNNTFMEPTVDLVNKEEGFKNSTDDQGLGANKAVTSEADLEINSRSLTVTGVSKYKAFETSFITYPSESTTKYSDFINTTSHLNKDLVLQRTVHVNGSKDSIKDNLSQTELKNYNEIAKSVILNNDTFKSNVRGSTYPNNTTYVSDIKAFETPNNKPYAVELKAKSFINSNTNIKTNHSLNLNDSTNEVLNVKRTQISNIPKAKTKDVLNKPISLLTNVSKNFALPNKSVTVRIQHSANGNHPNSEKDQILAAHNEHINTTVRFMNETEYNKKTNRLPENKSEQKEDKLLLTNDEHNESQNKVRNLTDSRALESASQLKSDHHSVIPTDKNIKGSSLTPLINGRQKVSTQINPKRPVITIPKYIGAAQATSIEKDIALVNQTQRTVHANVNNNFTSTIARKTTKITRAHATINNEKKIISLNCRNRNRGRYSDPDDCNKFYICIGKREPIIGRCPVNTVFSELKKQCTNNMSHCVRGSKFKCTAEGRFIDIFKHNVYYICIKSNQHFIRYKFQCQKGYYLNKTLVKCIEDSELEMQSQTSISNDNSKSEVSYNEDNKSNKDKSKPGHSQKSGEEFECEEEGKFADGNDCRRYYVCKKNHKSEFRRRKKKCDSDELFHKDRKKCVDAESYEC